MSDEDLEEFGVTDDDFRSAMDPTRRRPRQSKEESIYGIWATQAERTSRPTSSGNLFSRYTGGIQFVSGGIKVGSKIEKKKEKQVKKKPKIIESYESDDENDDKSDDGRFDDDNDSDVEIIEKKRRKRHDSTDDGDDTDDEEDRSDDDAEKDENDDEEDQSSEDEKVTRRNQAPTKPVPVSKDFGAFDKQNKGFAMKLMKKMGYKEGMGLGKNNQGRVNPIEASQRKGKGSIGSYGNEESNRQAEEKKKKKSKKSSKDEKAPSTQWKKQTVQKPAKEKYSFKTFNDVIKEHSNKFHNSKSTAAPNREKIIDMTGREQRVLHGYESFSSKQNFGSADTPQIFSLDELTHNLDLIIESSEETMIRAHRRRKFDEDTVVGLEHDLKETNTLLIDEENQMNRLNLLLETVDRCEKYAEQSRNISDLFFLQTVLEELKSKFHKEYRKYRLWDIVVPVLHQHLKEHLASDWKVFRTDATDEQYLLEIFRKWKTILEETTIDLTTEEGIPSKDVMDPYHRLIWDVWMPFLRRAILDWNPRQPDRLVDFLTRWIPLLPRWVIENIFEQLVYPKLQREVDLWDPLTDSIPIHSWLHPWLPLMDDRLEPLYQPIRTKLAQALLSWQPSDGSAKAVLLPWKPVFKQGTWDAFMNKHIVPKLIALMQQFVIDPRQQVLEPWYWFVSWYDVVPLPSMIAILEKSFFPQWHQVLNAWLNTNPNYQEIERWYSGWRSLLPEGIISHTIIKEKLTEGLIMIDRRLSGPSGNLSQGIPPPIAPTTGTADYDAIRNRGISSAVTNVVTSFKDLVERKASEHGLLFVPIPNRIYEGKQVYRFGNATIYIDKNVVFTSENGQWLPIRLNDLVRRA